MLTKQPLNISFNQGLETKVDPYQVPIGKFLSLSNSIFDTQGRLTKRNGFAPLARLPDTTNNYTTTFNGNLTAIGDTLQSYSSGTNLWTNKGNIKLASLSTLPIYRSSNNQSYADTVVASNGLAITAYIDNPASGVKYNYVITDTATGQNVIPVTLITATAGSINSSPRVFLLGEYFILAFGTSTNHIQYIAISSLNPTSVTAASDITTSYASASTISWDALTVNSRLYFAFNSTAGGQSVKLTYITPSLAPPVTAKVFAGQAASMFALAADITLSPTNPYIYVSYITPGSPQTAFTLIVDQNLNTIHSPITVPITNITGISETVSNIASTAINGTCNIYFESIYAYSSATLAADNAGAIYQIQVYPNGTTTGGTYLLVLSVALGSKAFVIDEETYMFVRYVSVYQPTNFLINGLGQVISRFAYQNAGGYSSIGLPNITVNGTIVQTPYLIKDLITTVNKGTDLAAGTPINNVYSQTGINLVTIDITTSDVITSEIGGSLNISGGMLWSYDGVAPVEQGFHVYPEPVGVSFTTTGGIVADGTYYYIATYEWTDNQGNVHRSAESLPSKLVVTGGGGTAAVTIAVPMYRLTYKSNVRIVVYRWSNAQQIYYAITSPATPPILSDPTSDFINISDTQSNAQIIGNPILYTTGGVIENIACPATNLVTLFDNRLWAVDAEDPNLLWFSKQVIEATPVEMSDLLTLFIAPTTGSQGSTGPITALSPMDDKLIIFKKDALGYINGQGPDNTGNNNQYSNYILINSVVGCAVQRSIVFTPQGLMFQSDKGIWLLGRDLSTSYIGAPVEALTKGAIVVNAINVPTTNQVRFTLDSGITLLYDYYYQQWGTFTNIPAVASTIYQSLHTYIDRFGRVFQETPGLYLDNSNPVLMSFTSGWINVAGIQGLERFFEMYLLGTYFTPFKLNVSLSYNYSSAVSQSTIVYPEATQGNYGDLSLFGGGDFFGGPTNVFKSRIFPQYQKCSSFQVTIDELYDPSFGIAAGEGLTLSGMNLLVGVLKGARNSPASRSFG